MVTFTVNGKEVKSQASADTPLLWVIRDEIGLKELSLVVVLLCAVHVQCI